MNLHPLQSSRHRKKLLGVLLLALVVEVFYTFFIPPWQHYDEPTQFEYAWLIANRPGRPQPGDYEQRMRREVAASMLEHGFFEGLNFHPNLLSQSEPIWIGISQLDDQPLYYWITALPLRILKYSEITTQLYAARLVTVVFFLGILLAGMGLVEKITGNPDSNLVWLVPLTVVLIPGVQDILSAVNNDAGAAFFFTVFLWGSARLVRQGLKWFDMLWVTAAAVLCYFTKSTVIAAVVLLPAVLLFAAFRERRVWIAYTTLVGASLAITLGVLGWGNAAAWTSYLPQAGQNRQEVPDSSGDPYSLTIHLSPEFRSNVLMQALALEQRNTLKGNPVTLAGWLWADRSAAVDVGFNSRNDIQIFSPLVATKEKQLFVVHLEAPASIDYPWIELRARMLGETQEVQVYFDDLLMVTGDISRQEMRELYQPAEDVSLPASKEILNGLVNPSAERGWFRLRSWVMQRLPYVVTTNFNIALSSLSNLPATGWYFRAAARNAFQTFWVGYGWGSVSLGGNFAYPILGLVTLTGFGGYLALIYRRRRQVNWALFTVLLLSAEIVWSQTLLRGISSLYGVLLLPVARYALPVIILSVFPFTAGWRAIGDYLVRRHLISRRACLAIYVIFLAVLNVAAVYNLYSIYYNS